MLGLFLFAGGCSWKQYYKRWFWEQTINFFTPIFYSMLNYGLKDLLLCRKYLPGKMIFHNVLLTPDYSKHLSVDKTNSEYNLIYKLVVNASWFHAKYISHWSCLLSVLHVKILSDKQQCIPRKPDLIGSSLTIPSNCSSALSTHIAHSYFK